jgi:hypothetical protein
MGRGFEADPSADEEEEKSEGGRHQRRRASDGGRWNPSFSAINLSSSNGP